MNIILPPKRFQEYNDPKFDPIRHKPWFPRLIFRRSKITFLRAALESWKKDRSKQKEACALYGVDERELRDYSAFVEGKPISCDNRNQFQSCLDEAYRDYCDGGAQHGIRHYIDILAPLYGLKARHVNELWDTDPTFYPTGY